MEQLNQVVTEFAAILWLSVLGLQIIFFILLLGQRKQNAKIKKNQQHLFRGIEDQNLEEILEKHLNRVELVHRELKKIEKNNNEISKDLERCLQKVGVVRFSAFENTGSDLSFSLALLDKNDNGMIISSLYGRDESRTYIKSVEKGQSGHHLSEEEKKALQIAREAKP